ncbi:MAG: 50S ribosomal protein L33 [Treponema sp.]|nr:50S ribosomal protein L33 [Treponema sp.]
MLSFQRNRRGKSGKLHYVKYCPSCSGGRQNQVLQRIA